MEFVELEIAQPRKTTCPKCAGSGKQSFLLIFVVDCSMCGGQGAVDEEPKREVFHSVGLESYDETDDDDEEDDEKGGLL